MASEEFYTLCGVIETVLLDPKLKYEAVLIGGVFIKFQNVRPPEQMYPTWKLSGDGFGLGCFVSKCRINSEGVIDLVLRVFIPLQQVPSWLLTTTSQQQTAARLSKTTTGLKLE